MSITLTPTTYYTDQDVFHYSTDNVVIASLSLRDDELNAALSSGGGGGLPDPGAAKNVLMSNGATWESDSIFGANNHWTKAQYEDFSAVTSSAGSYTGSIVNGSYSLILYPTGTGSQVYVGETITIAGAGASGVDLTTTITNISGDTVIVADAASGTVTTVPVTTNQAGQINLQNANNFNFTLTANTTLSPPSNVVAGQSGMIIFTQGSSAYTLGFTTFWNFPSGIIPTLNSASGSKLSIIYTIDNTGTFAICTSTSLLPPATVSGNVLEANGVSWVSTNFLAQNHTWTKAQRGAFVALTNSSGTIAIDLALSNNYNHTMTTNGTLAAPSNATAGQSGIIEITNGGNLYLLTVNSFWKFAGGVPSPLLTGTTSAIDVISYIVASTGAYAICTIGKAIA